MSSKNKDIRIKRGGGEITIMIWEGGIIDCLSCSSYVFGTQLSYLAAVKSHGSTVYHSFFDKFFK